MDSLPSKRRRTSPSTSIAVTTGNTFLGQLPQNGASPSKRRSSFMSPTKASLARFYPTLLPRAKSAEPPRPASRESHASVEQHSVKNGGTNGVVADAAATASEGVETGTNGVGKEQGPLASPGRKSPPPEEDNALATEGESLVVSELRASPPDEVGYEGTMISDTNGLQQEPFAEAVDMGSTAVTIIPDSQNPQVPSTPTQRAPHVPTSGMSIGEDGEPSLPPTPSQLGLEPPRERPQGPLFSSPSKRPRRKERPTAKFSPLKLPAVTLDSSSERPKSLVASLGPRRYIANTPKPPPLPEETHILQLRIRLADLEKQLQNIEDKLLRQLLVSSWQQKGGRNGKDIAKRRKDVVQRSTKVVQLRDQILQAEAAQSKDHSQVELGAVDGEVASTEAPTLTQRLANFMPFAMKPPPSEPKPPSPRNNDMNHVLDLDEPQTTAEPFTITTSDTSLLPSTVDKNLLQRQKVTMSAAQQSLTCDLHLTVNTATQQISHLDVQALSPWAEPELGSWLRQPHEEMQLAALGKAFGRYWEAVRLRCQGWISCTQRVKELAVAKAPSSTPESLNDPLLYLGMQELVLARSNVQLRIHWGVSLTEQGEVQTQSSAHARFPPAFWRGEEASSELGKIGDAFEMLVEDKGISEAVGVVCRIVFPEVDE